MRCSLAMLPWLGSWCMACQSVASHTGRVSVSGALWSLTPPRAWSVYGGAVLSPSNAPCLAPLVAPALWQHSGPWPFSRPLHVDVLASPLGIGRLPSLAPSLPILRSLVPGILLPPLPPCIATHQPSPMNLAKPPPQPVGPLDHLQHSLASHSALLPGLLLVIGRDSLLGCFEHCLVLPLLGCILHGLILFLNNVTFLGCFFLLPLLAACGLAL